MNEYNFGGLDEEYCQYENSKYVVLPVPYDKTSTWGQGSEKGPDAILEASANMELYDIETRTQPYKKGIFTAEKIETDKEPEYLFEMVLEKARKFIKDDKILVTIGGNHCVPIGSCKAYAEKYENLSVLQIDAHSDMRDSYQDNKYSHACAMARMSEYAKPVMVGIRSMDSSELENIKGKDIFYASYIRKNPNWIKEAVNALTDNVYLTIDLDGFDPSIMPATGTPEPGGLYWYEVLDLFEEVAKNKKIVGFDVVELCPSENSNPSNFMAAKLIYKIMSIIEHSEK
ncbi:MAG: agmatinase [Candidatus Sericytochromatia bacterium]